MWIRAFIVLFLWDKYVGVASYFTSMWSDIHNYMQVILRADDYRSSCWGTGGRCCGCVLIKNRFAEIDQHHLPTTVALLPKMASMIASLLSFIFMRVRNRWQLKQLQHHSIHRKVSWKGAIIAFCGKFGFASSYLHIHECWCMADSWICMQVLRTDWRLDCWGFGWWYILLTDWQKSN